MLNFKHKSNKWLASKYSKWLKILERNENEAYKFESFIDEVRKEIDRRNRAQIYKYACYHLKNRGRNQFLAASIYANAVLNDPKYFTDSQTWEIGSYYTKTGCPFLVDLIMHNFYPFN